MGWEIMNLRREDGQVVEANRCRELTAGDIKDILREGAVQFVIASNRTTFRWIGLADCYQFWKGEVTLHLCKGDKFFLKDYPGEYCYTAREWRLSTGERVIVLEIYH
ncbi:MAG: hypothetical protein ACYDBB_24155 [Armatimonadota bacterium]